MPIDELFQRNKDWAAALTREDPEYFSRMSKDQRPEYLWIGCSDSRVPATQIVDLPPGKIFVHYNIANVVVHSDLNCLSVIQYAIETLKVKHIIVAGHYGCGGIRAAVENKENRMIDNWLRHIADIERIHRAKLDALETEEQRLNLLAELNVQEQVANVCRTSVIRRAWESGQEVTVYGLIYEMANGQLKDLGLRVNGIGQMTEIQQQEG
ncbi:MAG: carbonate dehydratase [Verrucomicrobiae bacterium]|nr:carbonate dehydratase [Verrucomicrobiae bacterium]NNJ41798.1 carbonate dehydratase [Akkermansiaceae bacterium]